MNGQSLLIPPYREYVLVILLVLAFLVDTFTGFGTWVIVIVSGLAALPTFIEAGKKLLKKQLTIDAFNTFAVIASFATGELRSAAFIGLMLTFARYLDWRTASRSKAAIEELMRLKPITARRENADGTEQDVPSEVIQTGDIVVVAMGSRVPVDGVVIGGEAHVNESSVTGESRLIHKGVGDLVVSSTLVEGGGVRMRATAVGADSTIERMATLIRDAMKHKSRAEHLADRFASLFLPFVVLLALGAYLWTHDIRVVAAIFLVSCADDMAVAIPLAITAAVGRAAKRGVIIKGGEWLDVLGRLKTVVLDKTGTLTYGSLSLAQVDLAPGVSEQTFWAAVGSAEKFSEHPVGRMAYAEAMKRVGTITDPLSSEVYKGKGIAAKTQQGMVQIGNQAMVDERNLPLPGQSEGREEVGSTFFVFLDKAYLGTVRVADQPRPEAAEGLRQLRTVGVERIIMYTGDNTATAKAVSRELGITEVHAAMQPKDKLEGLEALLAESGPVAMVGDGINDAPALARADVGIAMGGGTAIASEAADVVILSDNMSRIPEMIRLGQRTTSVIHWDMGIWAVTNLLGFILVFAGVLSPPLAALYNLITDFFPLINSARLFRNGTSNTM